jgi:2-methylcitrate dehydratase PrpD
MHPGWAAACGLTAVRLAAAGFTGPRSTYEGRFGLYATHLSANPEKWALPAATAGLGTVWETLQVAIKPFPACQLSISCIDAAIGLATRHAVDPARIVRIEALIPQHAVAIVCEPAAAKRRPASARDVQFSLQFDIACALLRGRFGLAELELYRDPRILALADKVEYRVDPDTGYPKHFSGEVIVTLDDGRRVSQREQVNLGAADNPVPQEGIIGKFIGNATMAVDEVRARSVCERVLAIDEEEDARALVRFLGGAGR